MLQTKAEIEKNYNVEIQVMETHQDLKNFSQILYIFLICKHWKKVVNT